MTIIGLLSDTHLYYDGRLRGKHMVVTIIGLLSDTHLYYEGKW